MCVRGELPLSAIHINLEERDKQIRSFLIEGGTLPARPPHGICVPGRLINTIRVVCASYEDYGHWLLCLQTEQASPGCTSVGGHKAKLRRAGSNRSPRSKAQGEGPGPAIPLHLNLTKLRLEDGPEAPDHSLERPHSPLYADPYTPPATSHRRVTDIQDLDKFLSAMQSSLGPEPSNPFPLVPVSVPVSDPSSGLSGPHLLSEKGVLQARASQRHRGSIKGRGSRPPGSPQLVSPAREVAPEPPPPPPDGRPPRSYDSVWDKALSPSHQRWPRAPEAEGGLVQWI
ncbi:Pleckstrin homology domain-containing family N member 1, partial [Eschrichtius robustus]|nr:Pleckstrin homology domain-containing family N member 1 [Eschrichtius robustus]